MPTSTLYTAPGHVTGNAQDTAGAGYLGAALLALNAEGVRRVQVVWTGGTVTPNSREYALRLQYRVGASGPFADVTDPAGRPVEYRRSATPGDFQVLGPVELPAAADNQPLVQLRWVYYRTSAGPNSGARDELRLDDIRVRVLETVPPVLTLQPAPLSGLALLEARGLFRRLAQVQSTRDFVTWEDEQFLQGGWDGRGQLLVPLLPDRPTCFFRLWAP